MTGLEGGGKAKQVALRGCVHAGCGVGSDLAMAAYDVGPLPFFLIGARVSLGWVFCF